MCGRTTEKHGARLLVDYRIPRDWGGRDEKENTWVICDSCSIGKAENFQDDKSALKWIGIIFANDILRAGEC
jgi:HNH endonuclease